MDRACPDRSGADFGSTVIATMVKQTANGEGRLAYVPSGVV
jgi:hypothetical protein